MPATLSTNRLMDSVFPATLALLVLAGGATAIGSAWFEGDPSAGRQPSASAPVAPRVVQLPAVEVTGKRFERGPAWAGEPVQTGSPQV